MNIYPNSACCCTLDRRTFDPEAVAVAAVAVAAVVAAVAAAVLRCWKTFPERRFQISNATNEN